MSLLREYIRTLLEVREPEDDERSDTFKVIKLFFSDGGAMQAMELGELLPDIDSNVLDMMSVIESRVEEIIQIGRGDFPDFWNPGGGRAVKEPKENEFVKPIMDLVQKLKEIAQGEIDGPGHDDEWADMNAQAKELYKEARYALHAVSSVVTHEYTPEEISKGQGDGKWFIALAERFGLDYEPIT